MAKLSAIKLPSGIMVRQTITVRAKTFEFAIGEYAAVLHLRTVQKTLFLTSLLFI